MRRILDHRLVFEPVVKPDAKELISSLLTENPLIRPTVLETFSAPWMKRLQAELHIPDRGPPPAFIPATGTVVVVESRRPPSRQLGSSIPARSSRVAANTRDCDKLLDPAASTRLKTKDTNVKALPSNGSASADESCISVCEELATGIS